MNLREVELLSSYLDGQLSPSDSARLEARLKTDRELVSVLDDLRAARSLLRRLPQRRAPRNFTLTRKMVGQNPPLPRAYPAFRFATALAALLFFFTYSLNSIALQSAAPAPGLGMGGGAVEQPEMFSAQAPAATEAPAAALEPTLIPLPTQQIPAEDAARTQVIPLTKEGVGYADGQIDLRAQGEAPVPLIWQVALATIAIVGGLFMLIMRRSALNRWRG